jgi:hypothetical protein
VRWRCLECTSQLPDAACGCCVRLWRRTFACGRRRYLPEGGGKVALLTAVSLLTVIYFSGNSLESSFPLSCIVSLHVRRKTASPHRATATGMGLTIGFCALLRPNAAALRLHPGGSVADSFVRGCGVHPVGDSQLSSVWLFRAEHEKWSGCSLRCLQPRIADFSRMERPHAGSSRIFVAK